MSVTHKLKKRPPLGSDYRVGILNFEMDIFHLVILAVASHTCSSLHYRDRGDEYFVSARRLTRSARHAKLPTYLSRHEVILHRGQTQHIRCPSYREDEPVSLVFWFKGKHHLLARYTQPEIGSNYASSDRYQMSHSQDLIIHHVAETDEGQYVCSVVPSATGLQNKQTISVTVLADTPSFKEAMNRTACDAYLQRNQTHHIQCPSYREGESVSLVFWFKGGHLVARFANPAVGTNFISNRRYWMSSTHGLIINRVRATDGGDYVCGVVPSATGLQRKGAVRVTVLDTKFPIVDNLLVVNKTRLSLERGQEQELTCPALRMHRQTATIYWSLGNGEATDTSIIGVMFADGVIVANNSYDITESGSLILNTLHEPTGRFWCHVFLEHPGLSSAYCDVTWTVGSTMKSATTGNVDNAQEVILETNASFQASYRDPIALSAEKQPDGSAPVVVPVVCVFIVVTIVVSFAFLRRRNRQKDKAAGSEMKCKVGGKSSTHESNVDKCGQSKERVPKIAEGWTKTDGAVVTLENISDKHRGSAVKSSAV